MKKWGTLVIVLFATFIIIIDTTIMNVSISALVEDLDTTVSGIQTAISIYALVMAAFILVGAKIGDIWGPKKTFFIGAIIFGIGTSTAAISQNLTQLIIGWSIIEGIGSALMLPNTQVLLRGKYEGKDRVLGYAMVGAMMAIAAASGPIIGGFLTTFYTWRWAFAFEVIIVVTMILMHKFVNKDILPEKKPTLDIIGALISGLGLSAIIISILMAPDYGLIIAQQPIEIFGMLFAPFGLSPVVFIFGLGLMLLMLFFIWEEKVIVKNKTPLLNPQLLKNFNLDISLTSQFFQLIITAGFLFIYPLYLQITFNWTAMKTGAAMIPYSIAVLIFSLGGARLSRKVEPSKLITSGFLLSGLGFLMMALNIKPSFSANEIIPGSIVLGIGIGFISSQIVNMVISTVKKEETPEVAGVNATVGQLGNSIGVALIGGILVSTLILGINSSVNTSETFTAEEKTTITQKIEADAQVASDEQFTNYLESVGADSEKANELIQINSKARARAFAASILFLALISGFGFITSFKLPTISKL
jgi:MFS family permease